MFCRLSNISLIVGIFSAVACFQTQAELWRAKNYYRRLVNCIPLPVGRVWDLHWQVTSDFKLPGQPEAHWHWRGQWVQATATQAAARACLENRNPSYSRKFDCCGSENNFSGSHWSIRTSDWFEKIDFDRLFSDYYVAVCTGTDVRTSNSNRGAMKIEQDSWILGAERSPSQLSSNISGKVWVFCQTKP